MNIYQIFYPHAGVAVKFRTMPQEELDNFINQNNHLIPEEYVMKVVRICVLNFITDIIPALKSMDKASGDEFIMGIYNGSIMLNPILDMSTWINLTRSFNLFGQTTIDEILRKESEPDFDFSKGSTMLEEGGKTVDKRKKVFSIPLSKYVNLQKHLNGRVIGQEEAVAQLSSALKRAQAHLNDADRPIGVFLFSGPSGVGKSLIAKELQSYLFDSATLVRVDCGEYQQKHENQKLFGSPAGYVGYEDGGQLTKAVAKNPNTVILIDEAEKAHPDMWNTFLKVFEDGFLTDNKGNEVSFRNTIIIITSNLGNDEVARDMYGRKAGFNAGLKDGYKSRETPKREYVINKTEEAMRKYFKPELINRLDDIVVFNYLTQEDYRKIAELEMLIIENKLAKQQYHISWNDDALDLMSEKSGISIQGARGMSKTRRSLLEDPLADILLNTKQPKGTMFSVTVKNAQFVIS